MSSLLQKTKNKNRVLLGEHLLGLTPGRKVKKLYFWLLMTFLGYRCSLFSGWPSHTVRGRYSPAPQHLDHGQHLKNTAALVSLSHLLYISFAESHTAPFQGTNNMWHELKYTANILPSSVRKILSVSTANAFPSSSTNIWWLQKWKSNLHNLKKRKKKVKFEYSPPSLLYEGGMHIVGKGSTYVMFSRKIRVLLKSQLKATLINSNMN